MSERVGFVTMGDAGTAPEDVPALGVGMLGYAFMGKAHTNAYKKLDYIYTPPPARARLVSIGGRNRERVAADRRPGAVTEVVGVVDAVARLLEELPQTGVSLVSEPELGVGDSIVASRCGEHVQMGVGPAHRGLDDVVQPVKAHVRRNEQPAPDRGLGYAAQAELELHRGL